MVSFSKTAQTFGQDGRVTTTEARILKDLAARGQLNAADQEKLQALVSGASFDRADDRTSLESVLGNAKSKTPAAPGGSKPVDTQDLYSKTPGVKPNGVELSKKTVANLQRLLETDPAAYELAVAKINSMPKDATVNLSVRESTPTSTADLEKQKGAWDMAIAEDRAALIETTARKPKRDDQSVFDLAVNYKDQTVETKAGTPGNAAAVAAANADVAAWNERYASTFKFDNDVGTTVNNPAPSQEAVKALAAVLQKHAGVLNGATITLGGHTSTPGSDAHNQKLSEARAATVQGLLNGVLPAELKGKVTLTAAGFGESQPKVAADNTEALQQQNRRVEAQLTFAPNIIGDTPPETKTTTTGEVYRLTAYLDEPDRGGGGGGRGRAPREHKFRPLNPHKAIPCPKW